MLAIATAAAGSTAPVVLSHRGLTVVVCQGTGQDNSALCVHVFSFPISRKIYRLVHICWVARTPEKPLKRSGNQILKSGTLGVLSALYKLSAGLKSTFTVLQKDGMFIEGSFRESLHFSSSQRNQ